MKNEKDLKRKRNDNIDLVKINISKRNKKN